MEEKEDKKRLKPIIEGAQHLSLGISMVVAILIGVGIGLGLKSMFDTPWLLWVGVVIGVGAAGLNIYKEYSQQYKEFEKLAEEPRYKIKKQLEDDKYDDDDDYKSY